MRYEFFEGQFLHLQASHGFSPPLLSETLTPEGQINPDIQPETGWNYELGLKGDVEPGRDHKLVYSLTTYWLIANNLLVPKRVGNDQFVGQNAGKSRHLGVESELRYRRGTISTLNVEAWGSYSFMDHRFVDFSDEEVGEVYDGNFIPGVPQHQGSFGLDLKIYKPVKNSEPPMAFNLLTLSVNSQIVGGMYLRNDNVLKSPAYQVWNSKITLQLPIKKKQSESIIRRPKHFQRSLRLHDTRQCRFFRRSCPPILLSRYATKLLFEPSV